MCWWNKVLHVPVLTSLLPSDLFNSQRSSVNPNVFSAVDRKLRDRLSHVVTADTAPATT